MYNIYRCLICIEDVRILTGISSIKRFFEVKDLTQGKPMTGIIQFSIPLLIGNFAQQLYNTVDSIIVGKYIGDNALAAVGASGPLLNLLLVLFMGISTGAGIMVSQYFGAKDRENLSRTVGTCLVLTVMSSILIMFVGYFLSGAMIDLLNTPIEIKQMSKDYLQIIFLGIIGAAFYNILSGVLRGMGDSVYPLIFLLVASAINIFLDILFVSQFNMGVPGVAWATIIAQTISAILCILRLRAMKSVLTLNKETLKPDRKLASKLGKLGMPAGITQAIFSLSSIVVQSLTNSLGTQVIAASLVVMRVDGFCMMPNFTFGMAATTFVGQNIGANRIDRVRQGTRDTMKLGFSVAILLIIAILLFGKNLMHMFTDTKELVDMGAIALRILAPGYLAFAGTQIMSGVMRGAGDTMRPMWISIVTIVVLRVPTAYLLAWLTRSYEYPNGSPYSIFISLLTAWVSGFLITTVVYRRGKWKNKSVIA